MYDVPKIVRQRLKATESARNHPDPDLLTAFAEESLPDRERSTILEHLAECSDCRDVVALALPATEVTETHVTQSRPTWLTWPALRWGLAAAGIVVIASLGVVKYQRSSSRAMVSVSLKPEAPRTEAKAQVPAPPASIANEERSLANNASTLASNSPTREPKLVAPADLKRDQPMSRDARRLDGNIPSGPRSTVQQQIAGKVAAPATQSITKEETMPSAPPASAPALEARNAAPAFNLPGQGAGSGAGVGRQQEQLDYSKAKEPVRSAPALAVPNTPQDEWAVLKEGAKALPGQIGGYVVDPNGAAVGNAQITLTPSTGGIAATITDARGHWVIAGLPSGNYQVRAEAPGFKTTSREFAYDSNRPTMYVFPLSIGNVSGPVEVSGESAAVQTETAATSNAVTGMQVAPARGRNVSKLNAAARWSISASGALQRSFDQGRTWQDMNVLANAAPTANFASYDSLETVTAKAETKAKTETKKDSPQKALKQPAAAPLTFRAVTANGPEVWAGGSRSALFHSSDGGGHWTRVLPSSGSTVLTGDVIGLEFTDLQHGTAMTSTSEVWTTQDSGQTWQKQ